MLTSEEGEEFDSEEEEESLEEDENVDMEVVDDSSEEEFRPKKQLKNTKKSGTKTTKTPKATKVKPVTPKKPPKPPKPPKSPKVPKSPKPIKSPSSSTSRPRRDRSVAFSNIQQCYQFSSSTSTSTRTSTTTSTPTNTTRRSLFSDDLWITNMTKTVPAIKIKEWLSRNPSIQFPKTSMLLQKSHSQESKLTLFPYECHQFQTQEENVDSDSIPLSSKPLPKNKTGKKTRADVPNEQFKTILQIYEQNHHYLHAGGVVNGIHFLDSFIIDDSSNQTCKQYFAVCTSGINWYGELTQSTLPIPPHLYQLGVGYDYPHEIADSTSPYSHIPNMLQIYEVVINLKQPRSSSLTEEDERNSTISSVNLAYCVGFENIGPIWDVKWCPEESCNRQMKMDETILGTIAIISADGKCRVLVLPTPQAIKIQEPQVRTDGNGNVDVDANSNGNGNGNEADSCFIPDALKNTPIMFECDLCRWELFLPSECILSVAWGGGGGSSGEGNAESNDRTCSLLIACGLSTGAIAVWDLSLPTLRHSVNEKRQARLHSARGGVSLIDPKLITPILPLMKFVDLAVRVGNTTTSNSRAIACGVKTLSFCPYDGNLLASGGYDGALKIWNFRDKFKPIYSRDFFGYWLYAIEWNKNGCGIMWGSAGGASVNFDHLWAPVENYSRGISHSHPSYYGGVNKILNIPDPNMSFLSYSCSIGSDGSCVGSSYPLMRKPKQKADTIQFYRIHEVTMQEDLSLDGTTIKYAEIMISDEITMSKPDLNSRILPPTVALLGLHSTPLASAGSPQLSNRLSNFHLIASGGQAGLIHLHLIHPSCFLPRIQLFQET